MILVLVRISEESIVESKLVASDEPRDEENETILVQVYKEQCNSS